MMIVAYGAGLSGNGKEEIDRRVQRALADVGMLDSIQSVPYTISWSKKRGLLLPAFSPCNRTIFISGL
jgi:ABC-type ATPase involved in cell division